MGKWIFKTIKVAGSNKTEATELTKEQQERIPIYERALAAARDSKVPDPFFSNYHVKGSIGLSGTPMWPAGNIEYGICQALHCEETAVAVQRANHRKDITENPVLGFCSSEESADPPTCCGNCRDILLDAFGPELEIVAGKPNGGLALVSNLKNLLCEKYDGFELTARMNVWAQYVVEETARHGMKLTCDPYAPINVRPERRYDIVLECLKDKYFGSRDIMCDYHPIYAGRDAARQAIRNFDPFIQKIVVVCEMLPHMNNDTPPHVMYKDRQHLLETNLQAELITGGKNDPEVYLFTYENMGSGKLNTLSNLKLKISIVNAWKTTLKTWLPFPFSPRNFGPEFVKFLTDYHRNRGK